MKIQKSHVVVIVAQCLEGLLAVGGDIDVMAPLREQQLQDLVGGGTVFGDQDPTPRKGV